MIQISKEDFNLIITLIHDWENSPDTGHLSDQTVYDIHEMILRWENMQREGMGML